MRANCPGVRPPSKVMAATSARYYGPLLGGFGEDLEPEKVDKHPIRSLLIFVAAGSGIFAFGLFLLLTAMSVYGGIRLDSSVLNFYPLMAGAGALFGFERWWYHESGGVNPFHDR